MDYHEAGAGAGEQPLLVFSWGDNSSQQLLELAHGSQADEQYLHHVAGNGEATMFLLHRRSTVGQQRRATTSGVWSPPAPADASGAASGSGPGTIRSSSSTSTGAAMTRTRAKPFFVGRNLLFREEDLGAETVGPEFWRIDLEEFANVPIAALAAGDQHFLALSEDGLVFSWASSNEFGQCGRGVVSTKKTLPSVVSFASAASTQGLVKTAALLTKSTEDLLVNQVHPATFAIAHSAFRAKQIACGENHSLILTESGEVYAFGSNVHGQCGVYYSTGDVLAAVESYGQTPGNLSSRETHSIVLNETLTPNFYVGPDNVDVRVKGSKTEYEPSPPLTIATPVRVEGRLNGLPIRGIACGRHHSLAVGISGSAFTWGSNKRGQLGNGDETVKKAFAPVPVELPSSSPRGTSLFDQGAAGRSRKNSNAAAAPAAGGINDPTAQLSAQNHGCRLLAGGGQHSAFVLKTGQLFLCGDNSYGQLGHPVEELTESAIPLEVPFGDGGYDLQVRGVSLGDRHSVAVSLDSRVFAWGRNAEGQVLGMVSRVDEKRTCFSSEDAEAEAAIEELSPKVDKLKLQEAEAVSASEAEGAAHHDAGGALDVVPCSRAGTSSDLLPKVDVISSPVCLPLEALWGADGLLIREIFAVADHTIVIAERLHETPSDAMQVCRANQEESVLGRERGKSPSERAADQDDTMGILEAGAGGTKRRRVVRANSLDARAAEEFKALAKQAFESAMSGPPPGSRSPQKSADQPAPDSMEVDVLTRPKCKSPPNSQAVADIEDLFVRRPSRGRSEGARALRSLALSEEKHQLEVSDQQAAARGTTNSAIEAALLPTVPYYSSVPPPAAPTGPEAGTSSTSRAATAARPVVVQQGVFSTPMDEDHGLVLAPTAAAASSPSLLESSPRSLRLAGASPEQLRATASATSVAIQRADSTENFLPRHYSRGCRSEQAESISLNLRKTHKRKQLVLPGMADTVQFYSLDNAFFHQSAKALSHSSSLISSPSAEADLESLAGVQRGVGTVAGVAVAPAAASHPSSSGGAGGGLDLVNEARAFQAALLGAFATPAVLSCCFVFSGLSKVRLDVDGFVSGTAAIWNLVTEARRMLKRVDEEILAGEQQSVGSLFPAAAGGAGDHREGNGKTHVIQDGGRSADDEDVLDPMVRMAAWSAPLAQITEVENDEEDEVEMLDQKKSAGLHPDLQGRDRVVGAALPREELTGGADKPTASPASTPKGGTTRSKHQQMHKLRSRFERSLANLEGVLLDDWLAAIRAGLEKMQPSNLQHRDQVRALVLYLLCPVWQAAGTHLECSIETSTSSSSRGERGDDSSEGAGALWGQARPPSLVDVTRKSKSAQALGINRSLSGASSGSGMALGGAGNANEPLLLGRTTSGASADSQMRVEVPGEAAALPLPAAAAGAGPAAALPGATMTPSTTSNQNTPQQTASSATALPPTEAHYKALEDKRKDNLIHVWKLLQKSIMWLSREAKFEFLDILSTELTAFAIEERLLKNIQRMAQLLYFAKGHFQEKAVGTADGREAYVLNIDEAVWHHVYLLDMVFVAANDPSNNYLSKGKIKREAFHLDVLLEEKDRTELLQMLRRSPSAEINEQEQMSKFLVAPEADLYMFAQYARKQPLSLKSFADVACQYDKENQFCGLPRKVMSFIAHPHLCPTRYKQKMLEVENVMQHEVAVQHSMHAGLLNSLAAGTLTPQGITRDMIIDMIHFVIEVRREHLVHDAFRILESAGEEALVRPLRIKFKNEEGLDDGGLRREFFRLLSTEIFSPAYGMFQEVEGTRAVWFNLSAFDVGLTESDFRSVGKVIGLAVYNNVQGIHMSFPRVFFKKLVGEPLDRRHDLAQIYPSYATSIDAILGWRPAAGSSSSLAAANQEFEDTFCLDFSVSFTNALDARITVELVPGGLSKAVNYENREHFVELLTEYLLETQCEKLFKPLREGFRTVCNERSAISGTLFSDELSLIICGERVLDFDALREGASYLGFEKDAPFVHTFWSVVKNYPLDLKRAFLDFVTGSDIPPMGGLKELKLKIQKNGEEPTTRLPTSHTCYNILLLPEYSSRAKLDRLLRIAIGNAEGFGME
mmetsp:Transcript_14397/g.35955  ORF Transcript_14397/g.35955 Transcript_14397/m.35955 type:complete len:2085 (-) Transcript_14397:337-6591(-)